MEIIVRELRQDELKEASDLIFKTFYKYILPTYTMDGVEFFRDRTSPISLKMNTYDRSIVIYGAFVGTTLAGVLGSKGTNHICMFFTKNEYMGQGIGRKLFNHFLSRTNPNEPVTVNASDYGIPIYKKLGFEVVDERKEENGTVYTPMKFKK